MRWETKRIVGLNTYPTPLLSHTFAAQLEEQTGNTAKSLHEDDFSSFLDKGNQRLEVLRHEVDENCYSFKTGQMSS